MKRREFMSQTASFGVVMAAGSFWQFLSPMPKSSRHPQRKNSGCVYALRRSYRDRLCRSVGSLSGRDDPQPRHQIMTSRCRLSCSRSRKKQRPSTRLSRAQTRARLHVRLRASTESHRGAGTAEDGKALHAWLRKMSASTDVIMSVCTGAFQLGRAGLLAGKSATTHHDFFDQFARAFPDVTLKRGLRFVEEEEISSAGG